MDHLRRKLTKALLAMGTLSNLPLLMAANDTTTGAKNTNMNSFSTAPSLNALNDLPNTDKMPVLFLGHGSPMLAITETEFGRALSSLGKKLPEPTAILCISAHWMSEGSWVTAMDKPRTIHDFGGFPRALHEFQYRADGSPALAKATHKILETANIKSHLDSHEWGLDHGSWSVLTHLFPEANVPVVQLSMDYFKTPEQHYYLAQQLSTLRNKGILIVGSGNIVHNIGLSSSDDNYFAYDWAMETDDKIKQLIRRGEHKSLIHYDKFLGEGGKLSIPTDEHYLPLLYTLALQNKKDDVMIFNDKIMSGAISMTSVAIGV